MCGCGKSLYADQPAKAATTDLLISLGWGIDHRVNPPPYEKYYSSGEIVSVQNRTSGDIGRAQGVYFGKYGAKLKGGPRVRLSREKQISGKLLLLKSWNARERGGEKCNWWNGWRL
jgi:hypothetical protein